MNNTSQNINILLVEDDLNLGSLLKDYLSLKNFNVTLCDDGMKGLNEFVNNNFHLCILDIMLPKKDGFTLAEEIKKINQNVPIIFLTAKQMQEDKIKGLKVGADDYITKPFNSEELLLRINAILRRVESKNDPNETQNFNIGKFHFDYLNRSLKLKDKEIRLTSKEGELLKLLCQNKNHILNRDIALNKIWKTNNYFSARSMDVYISKLRNYLKQDKNIEIINEHGIGFRFVIRS